MFKREQPCTSPYHKKSCNSISSAPYSTPLHIVCHPDPYSPSPCSCSPSPCSLQPITAPFSPSLLPTAHHPAPFSPSLLPTAHHPSSHHRLMAALHLGWGTGGCCHRPKFILPSPSPMHWVWEILNPMVNPRSCSRAVHPPRKRLGTYGGCRNPLPWLGIEPRPRQ